MVVGDLSGVIQSFGVKKTEVSVVFKTLPCPLKVITPARQPWPPPPATRPPPLKVLTPDYSTHFAQPRPTTMPLTLPKLSSLPPPSSPTSPPAPPPPCLCLPLIQPTLSCSPCVRAGDEPSAWQGACAEGPDLCGHWQPGEGGKQGIGDMGMLATRL